MSAAGEEGDVPLARTAAPRSEDMSAAGPSGRHDDEPIVLWTETEIEVVADDTGEQAGRDVAWPEDAVGDVVEPMTRDTDGLVRTPRAKRRRHLLTRGLPALGLLGIILWCVQELRGMQPVEAPVVQIAEVVAGPVVVTEPLRAIGLPESEPEPEVSPLGRDAKLDGAHVSRLVDSRLGSREAFVPLLRDRPLAVVNLWASWCAPCKREMPEFRAMFERHREQWGESVRFVPVLVNERKDASWVRDQHAAVMPASDRFLVDDAVAGVWTTLVAEELLPADVALPVTLLVDCRGNVHWHRSRALQGSEFEALAQQIDELRAKVTPRYCRPKRETPPSQQSREQPKSTPSEAKAAAGPVQAAAAPPNCLGKCIDPTCDADEVCAYGKAKKACYCKGREMKQ